MSQPDGIALTLDHGDVATVPGDVLALKYAQGLYGADRFVYELLAARPSLPPELPAIDRFTLVESQGAIVPERVLFLGVSPLRRFDYRQIRKFGRRALACLSEVAPGTRSLLVTIHGPGYGLDEQESLRAQVGGFVDAIAAREFPGGLERIRVVELDPGRAERLARSLADLVPEGVLHTRAGAVVGALPAPSEAALRTAGRWSAEKPTAFVAMPFTPETDDVYYYGIQGAVNAAGYLCERADLAVFTGDILEWIKRRIGRATLVVADLTGANPNVYLEVGFAWGCGKPTVLLARDSADQLRFDVRGHRCLVYRSIRDLEEQLTCELLALAGAAPPGERLRGVPSRPRRPPVAATGR
jgi:hypothetical protein